MAGRRKQATSVADDNKDDDKVFIHYILLLFSDCNALCLHIYTYILSVRNFCTAKSSILSQRYYTVFLILTFLLLLDFAITFYTDI